jgi:glycogen/starch synthases, ADP-glucose type
MKILMATSETVPFSKSGGLADVVGALSFALARRGCEISVSMPLYGSLDSSEFTFYKAYDITVLGGYRNVPVLRKTLNDVTFYAISDPLFTERKGIYGDTSFTPYQDNPLRFSILSIVSTRLALDLKADILHAHDWTAGLIPLIAKEEKHPYKTIMTIHNLAYQGNYSKYDILFSAVRPTPRCFSGSGEGKRYNMLKTGLEYADAITTVSPTYAKEIQGEALGCGLNGLLTERGNVLSGIINGIDTDEWNSSTDPNFDFHFTKDNMEGKAKLKAEVQEEFGLEVRADVPLFGMISRLAEQKGFFELLEGDCSALEEILKTEDVQFIIIGTGDQTYENKLLELSERYSNLTAKIMFSNRAAHRVEGASDFFLMPSRYEPCGLNQLYSLRYGTLPIARKTGGLADSIVNLKEKPQEGTGFLFDELTRESIMEAVYGAVAFYRKDKTGFKNARLRAMNRDSSWDASADQYCRLYKSIIIGGEKDE